jgi:hypothetical protein
MFGVYLAPGGAIGGHRAPNDGARSPHQEAWHHTVASEFDSITWLPSGGH